MLFLLIAFIVVLVALIVIIGAFGTYYNQTKRVCSVLINPDIMNRLDLFRRGSVRVATNSSIDNTHFEIERVEVMSKELP